MTTTTSRANSRSNESPSSGPFYRATRSGRVLFDPLVAARFVDRPNRFIVRARIGGGIVEVACMDPGRMTEILLPGIELRLAPATRPGRRTLFTLVLARAGRRWVVLAPSLANRLFEAALQAGTAPGWRHAEVSGREIPVGSSRLDFALRWRKERWLVEVKSVGLAVGELGLFPDAPSARAVRHLGELAGLARRGARAGLVFVAQHPAINRVVPNTKLDPAFAAALLQAVQEGVRVMAVGCEVSPRGCRIVRRLPVGGIGSAMGRRKTAADLG